MATTSADPSTALLERTNALLDQYSTHTFSAEKYSSAIPLKSLAAYSNTGGGGHTENLTRTTSGAGGLYDQTGVSDEGLVMVQEDRSRTKEDLKEFKDRISTLKFAYLDQNARSEFLRHLIGVLDEEGKPVKITKEDNQNIGKSPLFHERNELKMSLRRKKERFAELENLIRKEAEQLEEPMRKRREEAEYAARLSKECEAMETEIAMLKNKRSPTERITLDQALSTVDSQVSQISEYGQRAIEAEKELKELRPKIKQAKLANERLSNTVGGLEREKREREEKGGGIDERAEQGCEWIENATKLYKSLLGIEETYTSGSSPASIVISFNAIKGNVGGKRSLSILLGPDGRMTGAKLIDSSQSIQDLVDFYLPSQDIKGMNRLSVQCVLLLISSFLFNQVRAFPAAERTSTHPPASPTLIPRAIVEKRKDDVIVNVGAVTVMTTVVEAAVPTTVFVEYTSKSTSSEPEGKVITSKVISTEIETVQTVVTQTAIETQIVKETVKQGVTIPVTVVTTGYEIDIKTQVVEIQSTVLETKVNVVTNTILGFENVATETVVETKTAGVGSKGEEEAAKPAATVPGTDVGKSNDDGQYTPEETGSLEAGKPSSSSSNISPTTTLGPNLNLNNTVEADSDASASLDSSNTNTNSVNVTLSSALTDPDSAKDWISQGNNAWILGGGIVAVILLIVGIIIVATCSGSRSNASSAPSSQAVNVSRAGGGGATGGTNPQPVMSSLASRPQRRQRKEYSQIDERGQESSELSDSSEGEGLSRRGRSGAGGGGYSGRSTVSRKSSRR
ncbi:hypothetical protein JCM5350_005370 [Sporobolomyces pararoseus]